MKWPMTPSRPFIIGAALALALVLIKDTRTAGLLIPEAAFIVLETQSQEVILARKEKQSLGANHALEFDNTKTEKAPAPLAVWLILPALWLLWRFRFINIHKL